MGGTHTRCDPFQVLRVHTEAPRHRGSGTVSTHHLVLCASVPLCRLQGLSEDRAISVRSIAAACLRVELAHPSTIALALSPVISSAHESEDASRRRPLLGPGDDPHGWIRGPRATR